MYKLYSTNEIHTKAPHEFGDIELQRKKQNG